VVSLSPSWEVVGQEVKLGHDHFLPYPFQFFFVLNIIIIIIIII
jgi:hypothetical protein